MLDLESWWSVTPEAVAYRIAWRTWNAVMHARHTEVPGTEREEKIESQGSREDDGEARRKTRVVDAFCGAGGNAIQFAYFFDEGKSRKIFPVLMEFTADIHFMLDRAVIAIDSDPVKIELAKNNGASLNRRCLLFIATYTDSPSMLTQHEYTVSKTGSLSYTPT